jgi:hypothetical protein
MGWISTADPSYEISLDAGKVVARNAAGKALRSVPSKLKDDDAVLQLRQLAEWLAQHEQTCRGEVEKWMLRSLPVPAPLLARVWPDEAWQNVLKDLIVAEIDEDGAWDTAEVGFLRAADERGIGVITLDGDTRRLAASSLAIPHPVLLPDLGELREFAAELDVKQSFDQLFRETWEKPSDLAAGALRYQRYAGGRFEQVRHLIGRATSLGFQVKGGSALARIVEDGRTVEARVWLGEAYDEYETETGPLEFVTGGTTVPLSGIGPVAWSEGVRMAAALYAGRVVKQEEGADQ